MLFSSVIFLYLFLPLTLLGYYLIDNRYRNNLLLFASIIFFGWGGVSYTLILIFSIVFNYFFGKQIQKHIDSKKGYWWLFSGVTFNILLLCIFKYTDFFIQSINDLFYAPPKEGLKLVRIVLPIGISFYTFHLLSYLVDIHRRKAIAQRNIFDLALYVSMFSQLIAGPIIRYSDVWNQLRSREHSLSKFSSGIERFLIGLGKKVLLANTFAFVVDEIFVVDPADLGGLNAWLGIICYSLQIYCDFSGYSDMAIGLGKMFGFEFLENFNYPYISKSVKEFWRRWHISLSTFFRDYVYIPLGGNKIKVSRTYLNLLLVFFLTGLWHGASWSFVVWGLFHGFFMVIERLGFDKVLDKIGKPFSTFYAILVVMFAWVLFRADTLTYALHYWRALFEFKITNQQYSLFLKYITPDFLIALVIALLGSFGFFKFAELRLQNSIANGSLKAKTLAYSYHTISVVFYSAVLVFCTLYLVAGTYNPFIYYRFRDG